MFFSAQEKLEVICYIINKFYYSKLLFWINSIEVDKSLLTSTIEDIWGAYPNGLLT